MKIKIEKYMRDFEYDDDHISSLLGMFDGYVKFVRNYDDEFGMDREDEPAMLVGYWNSGFGILFALLHLGHITTADFHHRLHENNEAFSLLPASGVDSIHEVCRSLF